jgi:hypothetical protein
MAESYIARLKDLRSNLLHLHKALVDLERKNYEQNHGKVSSNNFLQLLINNDQFAWLRFLSEMIVEIDEVLDAKEPVGEEQAGAILSNARKLLNPSTVSEIFDTKYREALQNDPTVVMAHQAVRETLK